LIHKHDNNYITQPKQAEESWPKVQETFHNWYWRLLHHTHSAHIKDNMQSTCSQQLQIYA